MKKLLSYFLALALLVSLLAGCTGGDKDKNTGSDNSNASVGADGNVDKDDVAFLESDGSSRYRLIRPAGDEDVEKTSMYLYQQIKKGLGTNIRNEEDTVDGADTYEILVGETNRPETQTAKAYLEKNVAGRYDDYIICTVGKKIVIYSENVENIRTAAEYFIKNYLKKEGVKGGILYTQVASGNFSAVTVNGVEVGKFDFIRPHYNSSYLTELEMKEIQTSIFDKTGYMMNIKHDQYNPTPAEYEVIVGDATRDGVEKIANADDYKITIKGNKIYLNGGSAHATAMAVSEFGKMLAKGSVTDVDSKSGNYTAGLANFDKSNKFYYKWGDDFNGSGIDFDTWTLVGEDPVAGMNNKLSIRSQDPNDVYVADGKFCIAGRQDEEYYYGGAIKTDKSMHYKYGYLESSMLLPHGDGFWVAIWTYSYPENSPMDSTKPNLSNSEIDIIECFGNSTTYQANLHAWPTTQGQQLGWVHTSLDKAPYQNEKRYKIPDEGAFLGQGFHTYGYLWDSTYHSFTCDGEIFFSYDITKSEQDMESFNHSAYPIISMRLGAANHKKITDDPKSWLETNKLMVDWINVYQKDDGLSSIVIK